MGLNICKHSCGCCPCGCCHHSMDVPVMSQNNNNKTLQPREFKEPEKPMAWYRTHPLQERLESIIDGRENPAFQDNNNVAPSGGPEEGPTHTNTSVLGYGNTKRLESIIDGRENPAFQDINNVAPPGGPEEGLTRTNTAVSGYSNAKRLETLSRKTRVTFSYKPRSAEDLEVNKGDELEVLEEKGTWILARTVNEDSEPKTGYIPRTFLANAGSLEAEDWYFNLGTKMDAKRYLMQKQNGSGSFLVWKMKDEDYCYLSVRVDSGVRNYRIHENSGSYYLVPRASFPSTQELVHYYLEQQDGLCTKLDKPCVKLDVPPVDSISHTMVNQLEIDPSSIKRVRQLGKGQFGLVWLGLWNGTTDVAIKELQVTAESLQKSLHQEAQTMWSLRHERLLQLYAVCLQTQPVFIVTEYMKHGTLKRYLRGHQELRDLEFHQLVDFAVQIAQGMAYMEHMGCVHRDLRSENILLSAMMSCKIGDFGLARFMDNSSIAMSAGAQIPIKWTAPEVFQHQKYSSKSDVWSFGVLLGEIMTYGQFPFPDKTNGEYRQDILNGKPLQPPSESPPGVLNIMEMCWRQQSNTRPSFTELEEFLMVLLNPVLVDDTVE